METFDLAITPTHVRHLVEGATVRVLNDAALWVVSSASLLKAEDGEDKIVLTLSDGVRSVDLMAFTDSILWGDYFDIMEPANLTDEALNAWHHRRGQVFDSRKYRRVNAIIN